MPELPISDPPAIVVTASRAEQAADETPASVTLIDAARIERLGAPLIADYLRLIPSVSVAISGPAGSLRLLCSRTARSAFLRIRMLIISTPTENAIAK